VHREKRKRNVTLFWNNMTYSKYALLPKFQIDVCDWLKFSLIGEWNWCQISRKISDLCARLDWKPRLLRRSCLVGSLFQDTSIFITYSYASPLNKNHNVTGNYRYWTDTYINIYHSSLIPEEVAETSQIFLSDAHVISKLLSYEEYCINDRCKCC
jgi:hypothetical protein